MFHYIRKTKLRLLVVALAISTSALLVGCGPEAPACNDPAVTSSVLKLIGQAHDERLAGLEAKTKDIVSITLDTPSVTAYDDKLTIRSCKVTFTVQASPDKVKAMNKYIAVVLNPILGALDSLNPFALLTNPGGTDLQKAKTEVTQYLLWNSNAREAPESIRTSLAYQVQKEEGKSNFYVTTNVNVASTGPYLRVMALADSFAKQQAQTEAKQTEANAKKQAETERLSATGKWRKVVYIYDFSDTRGPVGYCQSNGLYCFRARDSLNDADIVHYELDASRIDDHGNNGLLVAYRSHQPVCLGGVRKTQDPTVFKARGFSTFMNEKGEAVDCLPGAENTDWDALVAQTKKEQSASNGRPAAGSAPITAAGPTPAPSPAALPAPQPTSSGGPENVMSLIVRYEPCGEEAVCLHTGKGNTVWMQAGQMRRMDYTLLDQAIGKRSPVCLRDLVRTEGKNFTAEGLDSQC